MIHFHRNIGKYLIVIWVANCALAFSIAIKEVWIPYMNAVGESYTNIEHSPFNGTIFPIAYIPDWSKTINQDKSKRFEDFPISEFIPIPFYDPISLLDSKSTSKSSTILRYTYTAPYMGNYKLDYKEYAGGHLGVDIRAPIGTPVLSIANGVVVRTVEADATGNKFIVVRHSGVPGPNGGKRTIYSGYLHLSEILAKEGDIIMKGDMIGRVGISGITTTPHLHLQIDTAEAPFHPYWHFTSAESRSAGVGFYDAVNIGLNKDKAERYTIHPMTFINTYISGYNSEKNPDFVVAGGGAKTISSQSYPEPTRVIASYVVEDECIGKRFSDIGEKSSFGKILYPLVDKKCLFADLKGVFGSKEIISFREALVNSMKFFDINPVSGTSHFLDIPLGDSLQGYALAAYRMGIIEGNYANPSHIMTREELATLIVKVARADKNPSQIRIYADVDTMNPNYSYIQDYGFLVRARGGKFYPKTLATRGMFIQMLESTTKGNIEEKN